MSPAGAGPDRVVEVVRAGPLTTHQDGGRSGLAHLGVPRSGALDRAAHRLANRLVGNPPEAAVLETTMGGVAVRVRCPLTLAVTGAMAPVRAADRPVSWGEPVTVAAGSTVEVGPAEWGARSYVAVSGGFAPALVLRSRSRDLLSGLGPAPLADGDVLAVGAARGHPSGADEVLFSAPPDPLVLRLHPGPRRDWLTPAGLAALTGSAYVVTPASNRIALRLEGPTLERRVTEELPSEGIVTGAVQVPADGQPLVFLADHPTTGGYPVVAVVAADDLDGCAQARPGTGVRFRPAAR